MTYIQWALDAFKSKRQESYKLYDDYLNGRHRMDFVPAEFRRDFAALLKDARLNMCPAVVTSVRDRLKITALTHNGKVEKETVEGQELVKSDPTGEKLNAIWRRNRMEQRAGEVHLEALTTGDAYVVVWPSTVSQEVIIYPNTARQVVVSYSSEEPDLIEKAAKLVEMPDKRMRLTLYYPDRIEKYQTQQKSESISTLTEKAFQKISDTEDGANAWKVNNPYGRVPVFHFGNGAGCNGFGVSELKEAIPVQDALNKTVRDMLIGGEEQSLHQRWATGVEAQIDATTGKPVNEWTPGDFWTAKNENAKFGQLEAANLEQLQKVKEGYKIDMAMVTGCPPYMFFATGGNPPSGESLKILDFRLASKVSDRQAAFGNVWEEVYKFALKIEEIEGVELDAVWANTTPRDETNYQKAVVERVKELGLPPDQGLKELGYVDGEVRRFAEWRRTQGAEPIEA